MGNRRPLSELFNEDPPIIHFVNGDFPSSTNRGFR
jgi:hypothetical protein